MMPPSSPLLTRSFRTARSWQVVFVFCALFLFPQTAQAADSQHFFRVLLLQDQQTRVVLMGTMLLGICGGLVGVFMLLRKQSLIGDVVGHSSLPGIAGAFILCEIFFPGSGRNLPALMIGAFLTALLGAVSVTIIDRYSPLKSDAAMAITLSLFYGLGATLFTAVTQLPNAASAGLSSYLTGKTATLLTADVYFFAFAALVLSVVTFLFLKELTLLCFDEEFAKASGWPVRILDSLLISMVVSVTIIGMQTVGLILVVAILIIPATAAQFWTNQLKQLMLTSAAIGAGAAATGTLISALAPRLAAGPVIVLCGTVFFVISLLLGTQRGIIWKQRELKQLRRQTGVRDLLRSVYESLDSQDPKTPVTNLHLLEARFSFQQLLKMRSWTSAELRRNIKQALKQHLLEVAANQTYRLTPDGTALSLRAVRNHRLWELYLITYADTAPLNADYDADRIDHILGPEIIRELEKRLQARFPHAIPDSPHNLS